MRAEYLYAGLNANAIDTRVHTTSRNVYCSFLVRYRTWHGAPQNFSVQGMRFVNGIMVPFDFSFPAEVDVASLQEDTWHYVGSASTDGVKIADLAGGMQVDLFVVETATPVNRVCVG